MNYREKAEELKGIVRLQYIDHRCKGCGQVASIKINDKYFAEDSVQEALNEAKEEGRKEGLRKAAEVARGFGRSPYSMAGDIAFHIEKLMEGE